MKFLYVAVRSNPTHVNNTICMSSTDASFLYP